MNIKFTGRSSHRILKRFGRKTLCVLQYEVEGFVPEHNDGKSIIRGETKRWWVDATPEMLIRDNDQLLINQ